MMNKRMAVPGNWPGYRGWIVKNGLCLSAILFLGIVCFSQNILAFLPVSQGTSINVTLILNVSANNSSPAADKFSWGALDPWYYAGSTNNAAAANLGASNAGSCNLTWKEKALYGSGNIAPLITVRNLVTGDLIVRFDLISTGGGAPNQTITPYWLRYGMSTDPSGLDYYDTFIELCSNNITPSYPLDVMASQIPVAVNASNLATLALARNVAANTTTTLFNYMTTNFQMDGSAIISVFLVDNVAATSPQVIGIDTQTVYFNPPDGWLNIISATTNTAG